MKQHSGTKVVLYADHLKTNGEDYCIVTIAYHSEYMKTFTSPDHV